MDFRFGNKKLLALYESGRGQEDFPRSAVKGFFKAVAAVEAMPDERDLYKMKSLHCEKLKGERGSRGERSLRLDGQWRLIFILGSDDDGKFINFLEIVDYH